MVVVVVVEGADHDNKTKNVGSQISILFEGISHEFIEITTEIEELAPQDHSVKVSLLKV